jgi:membrane fusion protein, heavy metal efflux system
LYAQSLRGDRKLSDNPVKTTPIPTLNPKLSVPWWGVVPAGGAVMAGWFGLGIVWANRRHRKMVGSITSDLTSHPLSRSMPNDEADMPLALQSSKQSSKSEVDR